MGKRKDSVVCRIFLVSCSFFFIFLSTLIITMKRYVNYYKRQCLIISNYLLLLSLCHRNWLCYFFNFAAAHVVAVALVVSAQKVSSGVWLKLLLSKHVTHHFTLIITAMVSFIALFIYFFKLSNWHNLHHFLVSCPVPAAAAVAAQRWVLMSEWHIVAIQAFDSPFLPPFYSYRKCCCSL